MRRRIPWFGLYLACVAATLAMTQVRLTADRRFVEFGVVLTTSPAMAAETRRALIAEATRIWAHGGVRLTWEPPDHTPVPGQSLRLLAVERHSTMREPARPLVGQLVRLDRSRAVAMVSLNQAQRITDRVGANPRYRDHLLGIILGRAAAHEIGHYLLDMPTHVSQGLMREHFGEEEFAEPHTRSFDLDAEASAWIARRLAAGLPLGPGFVTPSASTVAPSSSGVAVAATSPLHSPLTASR